MTKGNIGMNAGTIWNLLEDNKGLSYKEIKDITALKDADLWSAIGWLARENKIDIDNTGRSVIFSAGTNFYY